MSKKIYLLRPVDDWEPWYDKCFGCVVIAENETEARDIAAAQAGDEGEDAWHSQIQTTCVELKPDGESRLIMCDFSAA